MDWHIVREFVQSAAALVALLRLAYLDLTKQFRALAWYLSLLCVSNLLGGGLSRHSAVYFWYYFAMIPLESAAGIFAVRELIALIFANYPGIRTVGRWALYAGVLLSVGTSLALTRLVFRTRGLPVSSGACSISRRRSARSTSALAIAIIAILFVLSKYPLNLGRNTYLCCAFFSAIFLIEAAQLLVDSSQRLLFYELAETVAAISISACLFAWALPATRTNSPCAANRSSDCARRQASSSTGVAEQPHDQGGEKIIFPILIEKACKSPETLVFSSPVRAI